eukprot:SAG31_NODE_12492_length_937_cov_1.681384_1_plen_159_part_00
MMAPILQLIVLSTLAATASAAARVSVFSSGIGGFPCVRVPSLLAVPGGPLLAFAECRSFTGDGCEPKHPPKGHLSSDIRDRVVCMRSSSDAGRTWGALRANVSRGRASYPTAAFSPRSRTVLLQFSAWPGDNTHARANYYNPSPMQVISYFLVFVPTM